MEFPKAPLRDGRKASVAGPGCEQRVEPRGGQMTSDRASPATKTLVARRSEHESAKQPQSQVSSARMVALDGESLAKGEKLMVERDADGADLAARPT